MLKRALFIGLLLASVASAQGVVNLYSARHYDSDTALYDAFSAQTGINVNVIEGTADELIERIRSEGQNSPADVFITVDAGRLWRAEQLGLLSAVDSDVLTTAIPEALRHPEGYWFGLATRVRVIVYNTETVDPSELSTYEALAGDEWQGRLCVRSSGNIYNQSLVASMIQTMGIQATEEWARGIVANFARDPQGGDTDQIRAVAAGECDVAIVNHYYLARLIDSENAADQQVAATVGLFFPNQDEDGAHVNISGGAVVATAPNRDNAVAFLEFLTTPEAQIIFARGSYEYPAVEGVDVSEVIAAFGDFEGDDVNVAVYGQNNPLAVQLLDRAGWR